ncbi:hypothetical protein HK097_009089 [Rhizophlyctis rosea]|uniref:SET domain-containing protein n=1 Tax=Rhizophlyctis rosea TaxID=64517 RepID=A0AAD5S9F9_9FUNG|nr:hypothetical protein HK097_009089 [Rhizophlyctis rosea]
MQVLPAGEFRIWGRDVRVVLVQDQGSGCGEGHVGWGGVGIVHSGRPTDRKIRNDAYTGQQLVYTDADHEAVVKLIIKAGSAKRVGSYMAAISGGASNCSYRSDSTVARYVNDAKSARGTNTKLLTPNKKQDDVAQYHRNQKGWCIAATKPIKAGSELFYSYASGYWTEGNEFHSGAWRNWKEVTARGPASFRGVEDYKPKEKKAAKAVDQ